MRILCYAQNLIGVGHFVRMLALARGLGAAAHEVHLVDGGRAAPRREGPFDPSLVTLPRLVRLGGRLAVEEDGSSVVEVLADRTRRLTEAAARIRPDAAPVMDRLAASPAAPRPPEPYTVLGCGGSTTNLGFLLAAIDAFRGLRARRALGTVPLLVFPGPVGEAGAAGLRAAMGDEPSQLFGFFPDFPAWLAGSALSIGRAGYNTCTQILAFGVRSILVPNPDNADQTPRARHALDLDAVAATRMTLERS